MGSWMQTWIVQSLALNETQLVSNSERNFELEPPHSGSPELAVADTKNGRVVIGQAASGRNHEGEYRMREIALWLRDPWGIRSHALGLIVTERLAHRIVLIDPKTGNLIKVLAETKNGDDFAHLDQDRVARLRPGVTLEKVRQQDCILPEGCDLNGDWLTWSSKAMGQIRMVNVITGEKRMHTEAMVILGGAAYVHLSLSHGSFGPDGTAFCSLWDLTGHRGRPVAYLPGGKVWAFGSNSGRWYGPGLPWDSSADYTSCSAVGRKDSGRPGSLIYGSSTPGLREITRTIPGNLKITEPLWLSARDAWDKAGFREAFGEGGWNQNSGYQPWGYSEATDRYLLYHGHVRPSA